MRKLLYTVITLIAVITFSCDNTAPSFDEALPDYRTLTTTVTPEASGTIEPAEGEFIEEAGIEILAVPEEGYVFERWEEDLSGSTNPDSLFFTGDRSVTAVFVPSDYPLTVTIVGSGSVSEEVIDRSEKQIVREKPLKPSENEPKSDQNTKRDLRDDKLERKVTEGSFSPESIPQNIEPKTIQTSQLVTTTVRLTAEPEEGWYFDRWEGDLTRSENPTEIVIDHEEEKNITAVFEEELQEYTLNVETQGEGSVDADPDMNSYTEGEEVTLSATPASDWEFIEWQGDLSGSNNPETIVMDADKSILARFELRDAPTMNITRQPSESTAGSPVLPAPQVVLTDDRGNPMNNVEITVGLSENAFTSGSTTTKMTNSEGAVEFDDLIIEISGTDYTLSFSADASRVSDVTSNPFDVIPASADPANSTAVVPDGFSGNPTTITITLEDEFGNLVSGAANQLTVNVSGANTESADVSESEDPGEYTAIYTPTVAGTDNIEIELDGSPISGSPFSSEVTTSDVNSSNSSVTANPTTLQVGNNSEVSVEVRDGSNNPITDLDPGNFNISVSGSGSANTISETATAGTYSFDVTNTTVEDVTVTVIVTGVTLEEAQITYSVGDPDDMQITTEPGESVAGQPISGPPAVQITDEFGNPVPSVNVTVSEQGGEPFSASSTPSVDTNNDGFAVFDEIALETAGTHNLVFSSAGLTSRTSSAFTVEAAPADPGSTTATVPGGVAGEETSITIDVSDEFGNPVSGAADQLTVTVSGANNATPAAVETGTSGQYSAGYTPTNDGTDTITISLDGTEITGSPFSSEVTTSDVSSANSTVTANPTALQVGSHSEVTVELKDDNNNPITGLNSGDFNITVSGNGSASTISETATDGTYSFDVTNTTAEDVSVTVSANGVTLNDTQISFTTTGPGNMQITTEPDESIAGQLIAGPPAVQITDGFDNPVSSVNVTVSEQGGESFSSSSTTSVDTNNDGFAVFDDIAIETAGTHNLVFSSTGLISRTSNAFNVEAAPANPESTTATVPDGTAGEETTITIDVSDEFGNPISGAANQLTVNVSGANSRSLGAIESGSPGEYTASYTPTVAGTDNIEIELDGSPISGSPFSSEVSASGVSSANSSVTANPTSLQVGNSSEVTVELKDDNNNPITDLDSGDFNISVSGNGSASTISETATDGTYSFDVSNTTAEDVTVTITANGVALNNTQISFTTTGPGNMQITTEPGESVAGQPISGLPAVQITDEFGNPVSSVNVTVSELGGEPFSPSSTPSVDTNSDGFAVFDNIAIETAGTYTLEFSSAGLPSQTSNAFTVDPAPADPGSTTATVPDGSAGEETTITIDVTDEFGNPVSGAADQLTVNISGANTGSPGVSEAGDPGEYTASYTPTVAGTDNIEIELDGLPISGSPFSSEVTTSDVNSSNSSVTANPTTLQVGNNSEVSVEVRDGSNNPITGLNSDNFNISVSGNGSASTISETATDGTYSFDVSNTTAEEVTVTVTATGVLLNDVLITYIAADPNDMQITTEPGESVAGQPIAGPPAVQITDEFGNPVSSVNVTVSELGEEPFSPSSTPSVDTNSDGFAVFDNIAIETAGTYTLEFSSAGLPSQTSNAFTVDPAPADPGSTTATVPDGSAGEETTITIDVTDEFGNPVSGAADQLTVNISGANTGSPGVSEAGDPGEYTASYTPTVAGTDTINISLDGTEITGSPFSSEVSPGIAVGYQINAIASPQTAGVPFSVTLTAVDTNDNIATGHNGTANLSTTAGDITPVSAGFTNGTVTLDVEVTETGTSQTITATDSENTGITQTSNGFDVEPGEVSPNLSEVSATSPHTADGTDASTVTIILRDTEGNAIGGLLDTDFTIEVGTNASAGTVNESVTDGTYTVEVTNDTPETVTVEVTANGVLLDENPTIVFEI